MSRSVLSWLVLTVVALGVVVQAAYMLYPQPRIGGDFLLRMYEDKCLFEHVDPYDVWNGTVRHPPFYAYGGMPNAETGEIHAVNAYPPWAYTYAFPLALLPVSVSGAIYFAFMLVVIGGLFVFSCRRGLKECSDRTKALWIATVPIFLSLPSIGSNFQSFNYPFVVLLATLAMVWCLERKRDFLAGCCWAVAMIKPQLALIYAIPLLLRKRYLTCFVAAAVCVLASIPPAILCGRNPVTLIAEGVTGSSGFFQGCGTFPYVLCRLVGNGMGSVCGLLVGAAICFWLLVRYTRNSGWFVQVAIAAAISTMWTYSQLYNSVMMWPLFVVMTEAFLRGPASWASRIMGGLVLLFMTRLYTFVHGFTMLFPERFGYPMELHNHLDSLNSFVSLCLVVVIVACWDRWRMKECQRMTALKAKIWNVVSRNDGEAKPGSCRSLRRLVLVCFLFVNLGLVLFQFVTNAVPYATREIHPGNSILVNGYDLSLRLNELSCIREGTDPFSVWDEQVFHPRYYPHDKNHLRTATRSRPVNAYTPWGYSMMMPLSFLPEGVAWWLHYLLMFLSVLLCSVASFYYGCRMMKTIDAGLFCAACSLMIIFGVWTDVRVGNLSLLISAAMCLMVFALQSGHDILAGVCWSFAMIKPQVSLLLVVPLLFARRYKTIVTAGIICAALSIPPAIMCGVSPVDLIIEAPKGSASALAGAGGCTFLPVWLLPRLESLVPLNLLLLAGVVVGFAICIYCNWCVRKISEWPLLFVAPVLLSVSWTYTQSHAFSICWIGLAVVAAEIVDSYRKRKRWKTVSLALFLFCMARGGDYLDRVLYRVISCFGFDVPSSFRPVFVWSWSFAAVVFLVFWSRYHMHESARQLRLAVGSGRSG